MLIKFDGVEIKCNEKEITLIYGKFNELVERKKKDGTKEMVLTDVGKKVYPSSLESALKLVVKFLLYTNYGELEVVEIKDLIDKQNEIKEYIKNKVEGL